MAKSFITIVKGKTSYKFNIEDIKKIYKVSKRKTPAIPTYFSGEKPSPDTDVDNDMPVDALRA